VPSVNPVFSGHQLHIHRSSIHHFALFAAPRRWLSRILLFNWRTIFFVEAM
jgi:hypothetical protein